VPGQGQQPPSGQYPVTVNNPYQPPVNTTTQPNPYQTSTYGNKPPQQPPQQQQQYPAQYPATPQYQPPPTYK